MAFIYLPAVLLGLVFGSFINVVIYRLPRGESLAFPPSRCPGCSHRLGITELVPVFSWLLQRGRCRHCGARISCRYPLIEVLTAVLFLLSVVWFGFNLQALIAAVMLSALEAVAAIDLEHQRVPNPLAAAIFILALLDLLLCPQMWRQSLIGFAVGGGFLLMLVIITRGRGMGMGDVKLMAAAGFYLGPIGTIIALALGFLLGAVIGGGLAAAGVIGRRQAVPFAPFLVLGIALSLFYGQELLQLYLTLLGV